ncbi:MAG: UDP-N-acetylmuramoyl-L-alanyl-D-glutamate--2,6-diaminopimelate ligase [Actinomycetota bacterium]|nr:UDP-N-acetylmuramoyl-L-alanyl-D-glutamate--2,6-diaminopimelate ligase [Actinomycetota bacterium]
MFLNRRRLEDILGARVPPEVAGVTGVAHDSRAVGPGYAFVAVPGFRRDGVEFAGEALRRGASLVVAEREVPGGGPAVVVPDARVALAALACAVYGDPSGDMEVYGVTGTNGKTTTSYVLYGVLAGAYGAAECGLTTTAETISGGERRPAGRTTPEAVEVQGLLAEMLGKGVRRVVMEVSSHGIALERVTGTRFAGAIFTNLTRDHLDLHGTMEEYYRAKRELFYRAEGPKLANAEDEWGRRLAGEAEGVTTFGRTEDADYRVAGVRATRRGTAFSLRHPGGTLELETPLLGGYNVLYVAGSAGLALAIGVVGAAVERAVREMGQVPGRFQRVAADGGFEVIVDYAHTDVGLAAVLEVARGVAESRGGAGRVICVFGAAGDRDGAKRPLMGRVASELADRSIITTDDAYSEDPAKIAREVAAGAEPGRTDVLLDRRKAIRKALLGARAGDVVVVAGKGHERVQHLPEGDVPFHDASVVREILEELGEKEG